MTARSSDATRRVVVVPKRFIKSGSTKQNSHPKKPKVTIGPKAYGIVKGQRVVIRFYVSQIGGFRRRPRKDAPWYVMDCETGKRARGTAQEGYQSKEEAVEVAREYRDEFGAYTRMPY